MEYLLEKARKEMIENFDKECCVALSNVFKKYGKDIDEFEVKRMMNLVFILKKEGIDTSHKLFDLLKKAKAQGIIGGDN